MRLVCKDSRAKEVTHHCFECEFSAALPLESGRLCYRSARVDSVPRAMHSNNMLSMRAQWIGLRKSCLAHEVVPIVEVQPAGTGEAHLLQSLVTTPALPANLVQHLSCHASEVAEGVLASDG